MRIPLKLLAAAAIGAALAHAPGAVAQDGKVLKIGSIFALTGPNASIGKESHDGSQYAARKINEAGGVEIGGEKYTIQIANIDDESKAERSVAAAEKLMSEEGVK